MFRVKVTATFCLFSWKKTYESSRVLWRISESRPSICFCTFLFNFFSCEMCLFVFIRCFGTTHAILRLRWAINYSACPSLARQTQEIKREIFTAICLKIINLRTNKRDRSSRETYWVYRIDWCYSGEKHELVEVLICRRYHSLRYKNPMNRVSI